MVISIISRVGGAVALVKTNVMSATQSTPEFADALGIVRELLRNLVEPHRITMIPHKSYVPIVLDRNSRHTICRLYRTPNLYLGTLSQRKVETRVRLSSTKDIPRYAEDMFEVVRKYNGAL